MSKQDKRDWGRLKRSELSKADHESKSRAAVKNCLNYIYTQIPETEDVKSLFLASYLAVFDELDLSLLEDDWEGSLALPSTERDDRRLVFREWKRGDELSHRRGVLFEPLSKKKKVHPYIIIVPVVAFDASLNRLGYGQGWYDRTLAHAKEKTKISIGVAFDCQKVRKIPIEKHDIKLDAVITESKVWS